MLGLLRFLLAMAVVLNHAGGIFKYQITGGVIAVQLFFMISGFYMALVLSEKYHPIKDKRDFWINRGARIYVTYFSVLVLVLIMEWLAYGVAKEGLFKHWQQYGDHLSAPQKVLMGLSVVTILGQDAWLYLQLGLDGLELNALGPPDTRVAYLLPMPQAWSVALELLFYALAPFLVRLSTRTLVLMALSAFVIRCAAGQMGYGNDPWSYRFFPFEITLFLAGMVSYRLSSAVERLVSAPRLVAASLIVLCLVAQPLVAVLRTIGVDEFVARFLIYALAMFALPCLFATTKRSKADKFLSEFSYPVYLVHFSIIHLLDAMMTGRAGVHQSLRVMVIILATVAVSYVLIVVVERPVDEFRRRRLKLALASRGNPS